MLKWLEMWIENRPRTRPHIMGFIGDAKDFGSNKLLECAMGLIVSPQNLYIEALTFNLKTGLLGYN